MRRISINHANRFIAAAWLAALCAAGARAEGLRVYGLAQEAQARSEAVVASLEGSGAAWYNPALLTRLPGLDVSLNLNNLFPFTSFTNTAGTEYKNNETHFLIPSAYAATPFGGGKWALGLAMNAPFGLASDYSTTSSFRYVTTGGEIKTLNINPSLAYKVSPTLSVAGGIMYFHSEAEVRQQYPWSVVVPGSSDGSLKIQGEGDGWGINTALAWSPREGHTLGLTYRSQVVVDYSGKEVEITNVPAALGIGSTYRTGAKTTLRWPDIAAVGYAWKPAPKLLVELGGHWANWQDFTEARFDFENNPAFLPDSTLDIRWKNTYALRAGFLHELGEMFSWTAGYTYDHSPTRESTFTPLVPDVDHNVISLGGIWKTGPWTFSVPATLMLPSGNNTVNNSRVQGEVDMIAYKIGLGMRYTFQ